MIECGWRVCTRIMHLFYVFGLLVVSTLGQNLTILPNEIGEPSPSSTKPQIPEVIVPWIPSATGSIPLQEASSSSQSMPSSNSSKFTTTPPRPTTYENPWAGTVNLPISQHGTGSDYALTCQRAWFSWTSINRDYMEATMTLFNWTSTIRSETVYETHIEYTTSYYTLCDGHPRVITSQPTFTSTETFLPSTTTILAGGLSARNYPDPNCTVSWDDCRELWSTYYSAKSVYDEISFGLANTVVQMGSGASYWMVNGVTTTFATASPEELSLGTEYIHKYYKTNEYIWVTTPKPGGLICDCGHVFTAGKEAITVQNTIDFTNTPYTPSCRTAQPTCTPGARCEIGGDRVEIFWFPPQTNATRDMCATAPANGPITSRPPTNYTWEPITTGPYAVLEGNTTWFSGNVYVSLNNIHGRCDWSGTDVEVGSTHNGRVLTMAPNELFSQRATAITTGDKSGMVGWEDHAYSFNFDDLISPYPWSAYGAGFDCVRTRCTEVNGPYNPWIAVPEAIRRLDPRWETCDLALYGLYDPPIALPTVGQLFPSPTPGPPESGPQPTPDPPQQNGPTNTPPKPGSPFSWPFNPEPTPQPQNPPNPPFTPPQNPKPQDPPRPPFVPPQNNPPPQNPSPNPPNPPFVLPPGNPQNPQNPSNPQNSPPFVIVPPQNPQNPQNPNPDPNPNGPRPGPVPPSNPQPTTIGIVGSTPIVINPENPTEIAIGTTVLAPGRPGITVDGGTTISMRDPGHIIIFGPGNAAPSTINIPRPVGGPGGAPAPTAGVVITMPDGSRVTATAIIGEGRDGTRTATSVLVSGTMFSVGGPPVTLPNGVILSEAPSGTGIVVIDPSSGVTSTIAFSSMPGIDSATPAPTVLVTIGTKTYTATSESGHVMIPELDLTVSDGGPASTINGTIISDAGDGTLMVGTGTKTVPPSTTTQGRGAQSPTAGAAREFGVTEWRMNLFVLGCGLLFVL